MYTLCHWCRVQDLVQRSAVRSSVVEELTEYGHAGGREHAGDGHGDEPGEGDVTEEVPADAAAALGNVADAHDRADLAVGGRYRQTGFARQQHRHRSADLESLNKTVIEFLLPKFFLVDIDSEALLCF